MPLDRNPDRSWCHHHYEYDKAFLDAAHGSIWTTGSIQGHNVLGVAYVKLGTSGRWVGTRTGAGVTSTLVKAFFVAAHGSMDIDGSIRGAMACDQNSFTLVWR